jgi:hypothetical protein
MIGYVLAMFGAMALFGGFALGIIFQNTTPISSYSPSTTPGGGQQTPTSVSSAYYMLSVALYTMLAGGIAIALGLGLELSSRQSSMAFGARRK